MSVSADSFPFSSFFIGLHLEPVIILFFVRFDVADDGLEFFFESFLPLRIFRSGMDGEERYFGGGLFN